MIRKVASLRLQFYQLAVAGCCLLLLSGCAAGPHYTTSTLPPPGTPGVYHRVDKGQTLWRIAKAYNIELEELARFNRISNTSAIEVGQLIFIPGRKEQLPLPSVYAGDDFIWPLKGEIINSFGQTRGSMINKGINIKPYDSLKVVAARNGRAVFYGDNFGGFGKTIIIDHGDGLFTVYARNSEVFIKPGDKVLKGAVIAKAGSAGRDKDRYLHFEVRQGHYARNPLFYLPR